MCIRDRYTSTAREIDGIGLSAGSNTYVATYTNQAGVTSTQTFTIKAGMVAPAPISSYATGIDNACQSTNWECDSGGVASPSLIVYPKLAFRGGNSSTGGNNCAVLVVHFNSAYTAVGTPTDNESETWSAGPSVTDSNTGLTMQTFYVPVSYTHLDVYKRQLVYSQHTTSQQHSTELAEQRLHGELHQCRGSHQHGDVYDHRRPHHHHSLSGGERRSVAGDEQCHGSGRQHG